MRTLRGLLKLFPRSFQEQMGEAWLEAAETEIRHRAQGRKLWPVMVAFCWETLANVLPQAYSLSKTQPLSEKSEKDFVAQPRPKISEWLEWFSGFVWFTFIGGGLCLYLVMLSVTDAQIHDFIVYWGLVLMVCFVFRANSLWKWWVTNKKPILAPLMFTTLGLFITSALLFFALWGTETPDQEYTAYQNVSEQMGLVGGSNQETNEWFAKGSLRPEKQKQWCGQAQIRLQTWQATLNTSLFTTALLQQTHVYGCWEENAYIALSHKLYLNSLKKSPREKILWFSKWMPVLGSLQNWEESKRQRFLLSSKKYCYQYTTTYFSLKDGPHSNSTVAPKDMGEVREFCEQFEGSKPVTVAQAAAVRLSIHQHYPL